MAFTPRLLLLSAAVADYAAAISRIPPADLRAYAFESAAAPASSRVRALASRLAMSPESPAASTAARLLGGPRRWSAWLQRLGAGDPQPSSDGEVACFIVDDSNQAGRVVCTETPEEYAWYEGIDASSMEEVDAGLLVEGHLECKEGATYRGTLVWDCSKDADAS
jgi:hypothetical protein